MNRSYASALSPEYALLGFLAKKTSHGYELHQRISAELGQVWHVSLSQVYNILNRLEGQGFIEGVIEEQDKLPARQMYHLTGSGRQRLETWLNTPTGSSVRAIRVEFVTRLYFASMLGEEKPFQLVQAQLKETRSGLKRLEQELAETPSSQVFNRLGLDLRLRQLEAVLSWLQQSVTVLYLDKSYHDNSISS
jgi:PadR family transcriptional regulator, regulatory protein AphA